MKILLLEDDLELCKNIKISLEKENYMVDCCNDGETAMLYALNTDYAYDLAIVDRMLPIIDGLTIIKSMRRKGISIPILIITAMSTLDNRVEGLDGGADDYLVKPFHIKELLARVRALTRRPANIQLSSKLEYGDLTFDKDSRTLSTPVNSILLTSKETELTFVFMQNPETLCAFMDNAIQHSKNNSLIEIEVIATEKNIAFSVADHGQGISDEDKQYIFDRFYSGDKSHMNKSNFGLGLSIAKELTQMLNGIITINDTAGGGATFTVKFPLK